MEQTRFDVKGAATALANLLERRGCVVNRDTLGNIEDVLIDRVGGRPSNFFGFNENDLRTMARAVRAYHGKHRKRGEEYLRRHGKPFVPEAGQENYDQAMMEACVAAEAKIVDAINALTTVPDTKETKLLRPAEVGGTWAK